MNIHEYQAKAISEEVRRARLKGAGNGLRRQRPSRLPTDNSARSTSSSRRSMPAVRRASSRSTAEAGSSVRLAFSIDEVTSDRQEMLDNTLVTVQTRTAGKQVNHLYIEERLRRARARELITVGAGRPRDRFGRLRRLDQGGMDIGRYGP